MKTTLILGAIAVATLFVAVGCYQREYGTTGRFDPDERVETFTLRDHGCYVLARIRDGYFTCVELPNGDFETVEKTSPLLDVFPEWPTQSQRARWTSTIEPSDSLWSSVFDARYCRRYHLFGSASPSQTACLKVSPHDIYVLLSVDDPLFEVYPEFPARHRPDGRCVYQFQPCTDIIPETSTQLSGQ